MSKTYKYLKDLNISESNMTCVYNTKEKEQDKGRRKRFRKQRKKYGFDERETWSLDYTLLTWLYSHLRMFLDNHGPVDLTFHHFDIPVLEDIPEEEREKVSGYVLHYQREVVKKDVCEEDAIKIAIEYLEKAITGSFSLEHEEELRGDECGRCALRLVAEILPCLWW